MPPPCADFYRKVTAIVAQSFLPKAQWKGGASTDAVPARHDRHVPLGRLLPA